MLERPIQNIQAYDFYIRGLQETWKYTERGYLQAIALLTKSLELTGANAFLNGTLSITYTRYYHYCIPDPSFLQKASEYGKKSIIMGFEKIASMKNNGDIMGFFKTK